MGQEQRSFATQWGIIHYWVSRCREDSPWLVFLPGLTADHRLFDGQIKVLGKHCHCLSWDAPAHGESRPFTLVFSMEDQAEFLHSILEREGITAPVLIGQSMGGYLAQMYMSKYPGSVRGFVSIDSCPLQRMYYTAIELYLLKHTKGLYLLFPWKLLQKAGSAGCAETPYGRAQMLRMMSSYEKEEYCALAAHGYRMLAEAVEMARDYRISCPALLLCGEKDAAGSAKRYNRQWTKREGIPLVWVKGAGHNSNTDDIEFVNAQIGQFVQGIV